MWDRPSVDFADTTLLPWMVTPHTEFGGAHGGGMHKVLSRDENDGAVTELLEIRNAQHGISNAALDLYVLSGSARINGELVVPGTYLYIHKSSLVSLVPEANGVTLYCASSESPQIVDDSGSVGMDLLEPDSAEWSSMSWRGEEKITNDVMIRMLRQDDSGIVFLTCMAPGYSTEVQEKHPVCEESFKLTGDLMMGSRGIIRPGGYFFRRPETWHGPLYTAFGSTSLIRKNAKGSTDYRDPEGDATMASIRRMAYGFGVDQGW